MAEEVQVISANPSNLDAFLRGDEADVFLAPLSEFSSGCTRRFALRFSLALKISSIVFFNSSVLQLNRCPIKFYQTLVAFVSTDEQLAIF